MKNISVFLTENFQFLDVKISIYLKRRVFVMDHAVTSIADVRHIVMTIPCRLVTSLRSVNLNVGVR